MFNFIILLFLRKRQFQSIKTDPVYICICSLFVLHIFRDWLIMNELEAFTCTKWVFTESDWISHHFIHLSGNNATINEVKRILIYGSYKLTTN